MYQTATPAAVHSRWESSSATGTLSGARGVEKRWAKAALRAACADNTPISTGIGTPCGGWMLKQLRVGAQLFQKYMGWNRVGMLLSLAIIVVAVVVLVHMLRDIKFDELARAVEATQLRHIAAAAAFVALGYFTLTFYDWFALRTIDRADIPYRIAALSAFTSYSIGHNIGATVFTGGAVRYRIYSTYGLDAIEVAKICFIAGLTFWLGNVTVLGLGIATTPHAAGLIDQLPDWANRGIGGAMLLVLLCYLGWVWSAPRELGKGGWKVNLPSGRSTLLQIGIGILDLSSCALAMYMLLPSEPNIGFVTIAVVFVSATMLGFASHAPGGLGVFDAAMLVALWQYDKERLLAGLLLFRLLYYVAPFIVALAILGAREFVLDLRGLRKRTSLEAMQPGARLRSKLEARKNIAE
jgi:uncharacterized membrane protein YbhN (UPF0104 family)